MNVSTEFNLRFAPPVRMHPISLFSITGKTETPANTKGAAVVEPAVQLDYAPPLTWHRRRWFKRCLVLAPFVLVLATSFRWGPPAWRHVQILHWQRQCLNNATRQSPIYADGQIVVGASRKWDALYALLSPPGKQTSGSIFLGRMNNASGESRLVALDLFDVSRFYSNSGCLRLRASVVTPAAFTTPKMNASEYQMTLRAGPKNGLRISSCRPQSADDPRLVLEGDLDGSQFIVDVWIQADDTVVFERRFTSSDSSVAALTPPSP